MLKRIMPLSDLDAKKAKPKEKDYKFRLPDPGGI